MKLFLLLLSYFVCVTTNAAARTTTNTTTATTSLTTFRNQQSTKSLSTWWLAVWWTKLQSPSRPARRPDVRHSKCHIGEPPVPFQQRQHHPRSAPEDRPRRRRPRGALRRPHHRDLPLQLRRIGLYPSQDPTMNRSFASGLKLTCPAADTDNTTALDRRTPNAFDNKYYVDLLNSEGLFTSDQDLLSDSRTRPFVRSYALNQTLFFQRFVVSMVKMGRLGVLTGSRGEIRANCSARNAGKKSLWSVVEEVVESTAAAAF